MFRQAIDTYTYYAYNMYMNNATINIKVDPQTKQQIQDFAAELGIPVSAILNAQIKQILRDRTVVLSTELEPTPYLINIMRQVEQDILAKKAAHAVTTPQELLAHLDSL